MTATGPDNLASDTPMTAPEVRQRARGHVFIVDNASDLLTLLREVLHDEHYNVTTTNYLSLTFEQIKVLQPDVIVLDLVIGQQSGWDLLEELHQTTATLNIPVVVTSTNQRLLAEAQADPKRFGGGYFIIKPFDLDVLLDAIHESAGAA